MVLDSDPLNIFGQPGCAFRWEEQTHRRRLAQEADRFCGGVLRRRLAQSPSPLACPFNAQTPSSCEIRVFRSDDVKTKMKSV